MTLTRRADERMIYEMVFDDTWYTADEKISLVPVNKMFGALVNWRDELSFCRETGLVITDFPYDQVTAGVDRADLGMGTSACTYLQTQGGMAHAFRGGGDLKRTSQATTA